MSEKFVQKTWDLGELFHSMEGDEVNQAIEELQANFEKFEQIRHLLNDELDAQKLLEIINQYEQGIRLLSKLVGYAQLLFSEDTQDQVAQAFLGKVQQLSAELENKTLFFNLWWKGLEDEVAGPLLKSAGDYAYWLKQMRLFKPHTLSEAEEKVINLKDVNGVQAIVTLYSSITNRYTFKLMEDGEEKQLTRGELSVYYRHHDAELREASYKELYRLYGEDAPILGQMYQYRARDWRSEQMDLRGHSSPMGARNLGNDIPDDVVDSLLEACQANSSIFHRFFRLKARWIGMDKLRRYDIYAPVAKGDKTYTFNEAIEMTLDSFRQFDPRFADLAQSILDEDHLDSEVRKGKRAGAFCATLTPDLTPWVLASYQGRPDDVATLAHELGHAVHSLLSNHHTALTQGASLPLAETASTFGEILLIDHLRALDTSPAVRQDLLFRQMDDAYATIMRQAYFSIFEKDAHDRILQGAAVDDISELYLENLKNQFGDSLDLSADFRYEWLAIPHFYHTPFYVYAYAFGQLLVFSLYKQYRQDEGEFKPRFIELLASGGSDSPVNILERAHLDVRSPEFWQGGFDVIDGILKELESLEVPA
ncbi:MAG: M3 family oligoendopeptidase [Chloroflexi bacterium]|nr:M3 family oligoendopeptidase [Chloroflexota bacterium]